MKSQKHAKQGSPDGRPLHLPTACPRPNGRPLAATSGLLLLQQHNGHPAVPTSQRVKPISPFLTFFCPSSRNLLDFTDYLKK